MSTPEADVERRPRAVVVTPVYNEEEALPAYVATVTRVLLDDADTEFRVLFVDDGSTDDSWALIDDLCRRDRRFRGVRLSRNFGSHVALSAGFEHVGPDADAVVTLAADLQDPPEVVLRFVEAWRNGADIVWGERTSRQDSRWKIFTSRMFQRALARHAMPSGSKFTTGSFLLMDSTVLDCFNQFREHNRVTFALVAWTGFDQARVRYARAARTTGTSGWTYTKMLRAMYDAFIGLSTLPTRVMKWAAGMAFLTAVLLVCYLIALATLTTTSAPGWASQMIVVSGFFAIQFTLMAIVGEYLNRIYTESMRRPFYFVSRDTERSTPTSFRRAGR